MNRRSSSSFFDAIFVVNLNRRADRWKNIVSECARAGLIASPTSQLKRVEAYDGSRFTVDAVQQSGLVSDVGIERMTRLPEQERIWGMDLSMGAVGCALSHADIWCQVLEQKLEHALVLEDDCLLPASSRSSSSFSDTVEHCVLPSLPSDWRFVFLSGLDPENQCPFLRVRKCAAAHNQNQKQKRDRFICRVPRIYRTTNCYLLNHRGAKDLLSTCIPFTFQLDTAMTTMLVDKKEQDQHRTPTYAPDSSLSAGVAAAAKDPSMGTEYASLLSCYCVDPPLAAQATRFNSDIQWKGHPDDHDFTAEEKSRLEHAGIV